LGLKRQRGIRRPWAGNPIILDRIKSTTPGDRQVWVFIGGSPEDGAEKMLFGRGRHQGGRSYFGVGGRVFLKGTAWGGGFEQDNLGGEMSEEAHLEAGPYGALSIFKAAHTGGRSEKVLCRG